MKAAAKASAQNTAATREIKRDRRMDGSFPFSPILSVAHHARENVCAATRTFFKRLCEICYNAQQGVALIPLAQLNILHGALFAI